MTAMVDLHGIAQISATGIADCLVEGTLVAVFAAGLLRVSRKENAGVRFAVLFSALAVIAALPFVGNLGAPLGVKTASAHAPVTVPGAWALYLFVAWAVIAAVGLARVGAGLVHLY